MNLPKLKLTIESAAAQLAEADLVPGRRWKHKNTGEVFTLCRFRPNGTLALLRDDFCMVLGPDGHVSQMTHEMLAWLAAEFEPVDAKKLEQQPLVNDLPPGTVFQFGRQIFVREMGDNRPGESLAIVNASEGWERDGIEFTLRADRVFGVLDLDLGVLGVLKGRP